MKHNQTGVSEFAFNSCVIFGAFNVLYRAFISHHRLFLNKLANESFSFDHIGQWELLIRSKLNGQ